MAKKKDRVENELQQGSLTHNPFAALGGGSGAKMPSSSGGAAPAEAGARRKPAAPARTGGKRPATGKRPVTGKRAATEKLPITGKLVVRFEAKGHGGKQVTRVAGLALDDAGLEALAKSARKALGAGARVEDGDVLIQGKLQDRVIAWLAKHGHPDAQRGN